MTLTAIQLKKIIEKMTNEIMPKRLLRKRCSLACQIGFNARFFNEAAGVTLVDE